MTTLLDPKIIRAAGKPPPATFETDAPASPPETDDVEEEEDKEKG